MAGVPDYYSQILAAAQQNLVRMPDGSYREAPVYGSATTVPEMYGNTMPSAPSRYSSIGPGPGLSGGYSFLQDMMDAGSPSLPQTPRTAPYVPFASSSVANNKSGARLPSTPASSDPYEAYAGVPKTPAQRAIEIEVHGGQQPQARVPTVPQQPFSPWGPSWPVGMNAMMPWELSNPGVAPEGDPWANDRFGIPVVPQRGYVTGNRALPKMPQRSGGGGLFGWLFGGGGNNAVPGVPRGAPSVPIAAVSTNSNDYMHSDAPIGLLAQQAGAGAQLPNSVVNSSRWQTGY